jgi:hypothetical protein
MSHIDTSFADVEEAKKNREHNKNLDLPRKLTYGE